MAGPGYQKTIAIEPAGSVGVSSNSTLVAPANPARVEACFINDSDAVIYLGFGSSAIYGRGIRLDPGGSKSIGSYRGDVYAITSGGAGGTSPTLLGTVSTATSGSSGSTLSGSHTVASGSNRLLIVEVGINTGSTVNVTGITYGGVAMTFLGRTNSTSATPHCRGEYWYLIAPAVGTATVAATWTGNSSSRVLAASTYQSVDQVTPLGAVSTNRSTALGTTPHLDVVSSPGELVVDALIHAASTDTTAAVGAGQTSVHSTTAGSGGSRSRLSGSEEAGAASVAMDWTLSGGSSWAILGAAVKPVIVTKNLCYVEV